MDPRQHNGPEDAQDYLWLAQDLWMEPSVWEWANNNQDVKDALLQTCNKEGCSNREIKVAEFKRCAACHKVFDLTSRRETFLIPVFHFQARYCSKVCQTADWPIHKEPCKTHKQYKAAVRSFGTGKPNVSSEFTMAAADSGLV